MRDQIEKFTGKLLRDGAAEAGRIWFYVSDDRYLPPGGEDPLKGRGERVLDDLHSVGILLVRPREPWAHLLVERLGDSAQKILPRDSETKTFFHDIPIVRDSGLGPDRRAELLTAALLHRKGAVLTGGHIAARATMTLEQAYITFSSILHACFVAYHLDVLARGYLLPDEPAIHRAALALRDERPAPNVELLQPGPLRGGPEIRREMCGAGRMMVEAGLVDSFFGNVSYFDGETIWISRTASSLDELEDAIDPVLLDGSSTAAVTASSELPAHRAIYERTDRRAILHGHPKFSVVASMICTEHGCTITDCGKLCDRVRHVPMMVDESACGETLLPVVAGEIGAGGLAKRVPPVIDQCGAALVYGHGLFVVGRDGFREAMERMLAMENGARRWILDMLPRSA